MDDFFPFIHKINKKKKEELQPLYVEIEPPPPELQNQNDKEEKEPHVVIIEL